MKISLTETLNWNENDVARMAFEPYEKASHRVIEGAKILAAKKAVRKHPWILTMKTLPDYIYEGIAMAEHLHVIDEENHCSAIKCGNVPFIRKLTGSGYAHNDKENKPILKFEDVMKDHPQAQEKWKHAEVLRGRGRKFQELIREYLNTAGFTSVQQICWSAPDLVGMMLTIEGKTHSHYGRLRSDRAIFLARCEKRRYLQHSDKRRPKKVLYMPDTLLPYIGEAKLLHSAIKGK